MKIWEMVVFSAFGLALVLMITMMVRDHVKKKRTARSFAARVQHADDEFARAYFPDPKQGDIAIRTRRVISKNLKMVLDGLRPGDRLNDDLDAELERNPHLFWDLEEEFGIKTGIEDIETFDQTIQRLVTFEDLVKFLEERISNTPPNAPAEEEEKPSRPYQWAMRAIPMLFIGGLGTAVVGIFVQKKTMMNVGAMIFVSGLAIWGFGNGGELLRGIIQEYWGRPWKEIAAHSWWLMFLVFLVVFFLFVGSTLTLAILKGLLR